MMSLLRICRRLSSSAISPLWSNNDFHSQQDVFIAEQRKNEILLGITEYVGNHAKVKAYVKRRSSHFHVNEIDLCGNIVHLTDLGSQTIVSRPKDQLFTHCTLFKESWSMGDAVNYLAKRLRIHPERISWAGFKDKWAITSQRICFEEIDIERLIQLTEQCQKMKLGNFSYDSTKLLPGDLKGNHFKILLENMTSDSPTVIQDFEKAAENFCHFGFINYFGLQRFGFGYELTKDLGTALLQLDWDKVFDLLLQKSVHDTPFLMQAKEIWFSTRDAEEAIKILQSTTGEKPNSYNLKSLWLLRGLAKHYKSRKFVQAFKFIPKSHRSLYYGAIKSLFWNKLVTFRIQQFGLKPVPGDMVHLRNDDLDNLSKLSTNFIITQKGDYKREFYRDDSKSSENVLLSHPVKVLTEKDFDSNGVCNNYSIYDVMLAVPGSLMTNYSHLVVQEYYEKMIKDHDLKFDCFAKFKQVYDEADEHHCRGFRHVLQKPAKLNYRLIFYDQEDNLDTFIESDVDVLVRTSNTSQINSNSNDETEIEIQKKDRLCAILEFSLPSSTYATMALREILG